MSIFTFIKSFFRFRRAGFSYNSFKTLVEQTKLLEHFPRKDFSFSESIEKYFPRSTFSLEHTVSCDIDSDFYRNIADVIKEE